MTYRPLIVDLVGTLVLSDHLHESALLAVRQELSNLIKIFLWLREGKASLKENLALHVKFDPSSLPYNQALLSWLKIQHAGGRKLILCTGADQSIANAVAAHLNIFSEAWGSNGKINLSGEAKANALVERWGEAGFDYVGNSAKDIRVWEKCNSAIIVNASASLAMKARKRFKVEAEFPSETSRFSAVFRMLRIKQWLKNILLFIPVIAAHKINDVSAVLSLVVAFVAFSFCASAVYILNDLSDIESDRLHPRKKTRPFASGDLPAWIGLLALPILLAGGLALASTVTRSFAAWLLFYFVVTSVYSKLLKRLVVVDCLTLALLYTLRVIAGAAAAGMALSFWLLAFSAFLFLSLAFVKRYAELEVMILAGKTKIHGRGYLTTDAPLIQSFGIAAGFAAVVVLSFYINSEAVLLLYKTPHVIWGLVPIVLFWICWMWMKAHRGEMYDDPLEFAFRDAASLASGAAFAVVAYLGTLSWPL